MRKITTTLAIMLAAASLAPTASAQDLLASKPVYTLGEAKSWTSSKGNTYTFITEDLSKLVATPTNTDNVFLLPQGIESEYVTEENKTIGIQGFYVDLGESQAVGTVSTTWEGAAADSYDIYLTDAEPTLAILDTTPTYSATGLGQYTANTAVLPEGSKGRYLVFQATKATNDGWGVKIRSIKATAPVDDELTSFSVSPALAFPGTETAVKFTFKNQLGVDIQADKVTVTFEGDATYADGKLTINSGNAVFTAIMGDKTLTATVYAPSAPALPEASAIKTPVFTNIDDDSKAEWTVAYNGGAIKNGTIPFSNGTVAKAFLNTQCVFFNNTETTGGWEADINPTEKGYRTLHLDIFGTKDVTGNVVFERTTKIGDNHPFTLKAGEWTSVDVELTGETVLHTMSVRFDANNMCDVLLANIYFTPAFVEGDEKAPVLDDVTATPAMTSVTLSLKATDDLSADVYYTISDGTKPYSASGKSGETVEYTVKGLAPSTEYTFTVTANDGKNVSNPKTVKVTTLGLPDAPTPSHAAENVVAIYSPTYGTTDVPSFANWGSNGTMTTAETTNGETVLSFNNYDGQWGGLDNLNTNLSKLDNHKDVTLHMDIYSDVDGELTIAPVWNEATGDTPNKTVNVEGGKWNHVEVPASDFDHPTYKTVKQFSMSNSTLPSFHVNNLYFAGTPNDDKPTGVEEVATEEAAVVDVFNMQGMRVRHNVSRAEATLDLAPGIYIIGGKKVLVK